MADLGEIVRGEAARYLQERFVTPDQRKALRAIAGCRTEAMGAVSITCDDCSAPYSMFRSCRNRSCPQCQGEARASWLEGRKAEILPVPYSQIVFTPPAEFNDLALYYPREFYDALMRAAGQAVIDVGWSELHLQLGCEAHLHTWGQGMPLHPHVHCVVPCGGFSEDDRWVAFKAEDLPAEALCRRFRVLLCRAVRAAARQGNFERLPETVEQLVGATEARQWRVYAEPPFGGPEQLLSYLAKYMYRVAITNDRIEAYENHQVTFRWCDYRGGNSDRLCTLDAQEFLRRYLLHVLPKGFVRVRSYGFMANRNRKRNNMRARQRIGIAAAPEREPFKPLRLCPACYEARRNGRPSQSAPRPEMAPQLILLLRPPPLEPATA